MRRLLRLALPLGLLAALAIPIGAYAQSTTINVTTTVAPDMAVTISTETGGGLALLAQSPTTGRQNTDLAFWGTTLVQGDTRGIRIFDITDPTNPNLLSDYACNGAYGDVSIWGTLVFRSIDVPQSSDDCTSVDQAKVVTGGNHTSTPQSTSITPGFEGIRIIDISNPASPSFVKGIATDCGSFTHTVVPDLANNRVLLYVSSFPNVAISDVPTTYGNTCELTTGLGHDKISIVEVKLDDPGSAHVVAEVQLGLKGYNSYFSYLPGYTGDFNNTPGYKGCHDIAVFMPTHTAAAACVTEGVTLDITNPEAPTVKDHFVSSYTDLCATGVHRWTTTQGTTATTSNCMWGSATFTADGKRIIWGELSSGTGGCNSANTGSAQSCNDGGNTNAGVDRFYDGTSQTNDCDLGGGGANRDPFVRGAFWMFDANDPSWPISSFKTPRFERYSSQGCTAHLMNVVPVNGKYVVPMAWELGGVDVVDWTDHLNPFELGWFDVNVFGNTGNFGGESLQAPGFIQTTATTTVPGPTTTVTRTVSLNQLGWNVRSAGNHAERSLAWAAYWYNGYVYASYNSPMYSSFNPDGSRGLEVFGLDDPTVAGAFDLPHLNPQTQENLLTCSVTVSGSPKVGKKSKVTVAVKVLGQPVLGANVKAKTYGVESVKGTLASGKVTFSFTPKKKAKKLNITVFDQPNMVGCKATKKITKKK
jgi:hypothetical protein